MYWLGLLCAVWHAHAAAQCAQFSALYSQIDRDLRHWDISLPSQLQQWDGITQSTMDVGLDELTRRGQKAVGIAFEGGIPYIISDVSDMALTSIGHHSNLIVAHLLPFTRYASNSHKCKDHASSLNS